MRPRIPASPGPVTWATSGRKAASRSHREGYAGPQPERLRRSRFAGLGDIHVANDTLPPAICSHFLTGCYGCDGAWCLLFITVAFAARSWHSAFQTVDCGARRCPFSRRSRPVPSGATSLDGRVSAARMSLALKAIGVVRHRFGISSRESRPKLTRRVRGKPGNALPQVYWNWTPLTSTSSRTGCSAAITLQSC